MGFGIEATFSGLSDDLGTVPTSDITVTNNNVDHTNTGFKPGTSDFPLPAISIIGEGGAAGAPTVRADVTGNTVPSNVTGNFLGTAIELFEFTGPDGILQLVDTAPASATATAQLTSTNTGSAAASANVSLIPGPLNLPPNLSPLPLMAATGDSAVAGAITSDELLGAPIDIGVLPAGKTITIQWQATIDPQTNQLIVNPVNQGQVTGNNFTSPVTTNQETTTLDSLSLGNFVFNDVNHNGVFDAGTDTGINGVVLTLFADDGDGVFDAGDTLLATTTTAGGGLYSFTGLAPGTYMVRVDQSPTTTATMAARVKIRSISPRPLPRPTSNLARPGVRRVRRSATTSCSRSRTRSEAPATM